MPTAVSKEAPLKLEFIVVGGGLAGFAVAFTLCKGGHKVRVLEKQATLGAPSSGLRVPPNMSKILKKWVGAEELAKIACLNVATPWYDLETGELMGNAQWKPAVMAETGGDFLMMKHEDVHRLLHRLATEAGAQVEFGVTVQEVQPGDPQPSVVLEDGRTLMADIIVGADGPNSIVRKTVLDVDDDEAEPSGYTAFGGIIPASEITKDPELTMLLQSNEWPVWMGNNRCICAHPVVRKVDCEHGPACSNCPKQKAKSEYAVQLCWPDEDAGTPPDVKESWFDVVPTSSVRFGPLSPLVQRMMDMTKFLYRSRWMKRDGIDYWIDETNRIVLVGEAAHPWFPSGAHGPAMAVEDAVVLGTLFSNLSSEDQIPTFLNAYQEIREGRTTEVNKNEASAAAFCRLPPGPARDARNASMRLSRDEWNDGSDGSMKKEFEGIAGLFGYEAEDAAQEWWVTWGRYGQAARESVQYGFETATVEGMAHLKLDE
ncbi:hypothetical protein NM688_g9165 [Phlebia brevispora]|uniref:Uncharacterized protein n=1 Tax=Phlebia brevispora TaxID=194682 RepID=A0ACC1RIR2_9APHY|nr:hypothetical protein NM688_g9165 [Phlebia brevispora]